MGGARGREHVGEEPLEPLAAPVALFEELALLLVERTHLRAEQQAVVAADHGERRAQLVADRVDQLRALGGVAAQALAQRFELAVHARELLAGLEQLGREPLRASVGGRLGFGFRGAARAAAASSGAPRSVVYVTRRAARDGPGHPRLHRPDFAFT